MKGRVLFTFIVLVLSCFNFYYAQEFHGSVSTPIYEGNFKALKEFIAKNNQYSIEINKGGMPGTVTVGYTISETGKLRNIKILRGLTAVCDSEAVRITRLITGWKPAIQWGKPISIQVAMPIEFYIKDDVQKEEKVTISGNVCYKATGAPIEGVLIIAKGTNVGCITDKNGNYSLNVPGDKFELEYTALGYGRKSEPIGRNRTINVELVPEDFVIDFSAN